MVPEDEKYLRSIQICDELSTNAYNAGEYAKAGEFRKKANEIKLRMNPDGQDNADIAGDYESMGDILIKAKKP